MCTVAVGRLCLLAPLVVGACSADSRPDREGASPPVAAASSAERPGGGDSLERVGVNGVELHYMIRGEGPRIVFAHGGLADYREWGPVAEQLSKQYRTINYSRRYNYPNANPSIPPDHSAKIEAEDLAALIRELKLGPVHLAGFSYGALTALSLALEHPELVRTLILVEPPLLRWLPELPGGTAIYAEFMGKLWEPAGRAFRASDTAQALRVTLEYFMGPGAVDQIPAELRSALLGNIREWEALTTSSDAFPLIRREDVARVTVPTLMLSGENSYPLGKLIDAELERVLPNEQRVIVPRATHETCNEQPAFCVAAIRAFLVRQ